MRIARFTSAGQVWYGLVEEDLIQPLAGDIFDDWSPSGAKIPVSDVKFMVPTVPSKILALGMNYRSHTKELNLEIPDEPVFFYKPPSALIGEKDTIIYPRQSKRVDYEGELAIVIGKKAKDVPLGKAAEYVLGYTCFNDITARDIQFRKTIEFVKSKSFDTFAAVGPWVTTGLDPGNLKVECLVNGELKQSGTTSDLVFGVPEIVSYLSTLMTLFPGDIIATGTPSGIGPLAVGDVVVVRVEEIGALENRVGVPASQSLASSSQAAESHPGLAGS